MLGEVRPGGGEEKEREEGGIGLVPAIFHLLVYYGHGELLYRSTVFRSNVIHTFIHDRPLLEYTTHTHTTRTHYSHATTGWTTSRASYVRTFREAPVGHGGAECALAQFKFFVVKLSVLHPLVHVLL